jgi:hypothetical protein
MNEKNTLLQELHRLNQFYSATRIQSVNGINPSEEILFQMETLLVNYLERHPQDTDMWLKLTMVEFHPPWEDYDRIEKYITAILKYDKNNIQALLILAYAQYIYRGEVSDNLCVHLQDCCTITTDKELLSMIYLAIAWYYSSKNELVYEKTLLQSISYCDEHVDNYLLLARRYFKTKRNTEARIMVYRALANIRKIYRDGDASFDVTDIKPFFDEYFKGTYITQPNLRSIKRLLE